MEPNPPPPQGPPKGEPERTEPMEPIHPPPKNKLTGPSLWNLTSTHSQKEGEPNRAPEPNLGSVQAHPGGHLLKN